ncbi:hypothetical protein [Flavobacterium sp.]|uniref:hypothetical protein n=1 Tax=Flavobacterium sp. TaxID=239 RepID=UPI00263032D2|nr:hypothetical protein [Flavobacterium sp.]
MNTKYLFLTFFISFLSFSQTKNDSITKYKSHLEAYNEKEKRKPLEESGTFFDFDITIPFRGNKTYGEIDENGNRSDYWFLADGLGAKFGYGIHYDQWIKLSINSGFDTVLQQKLVSVPVYASVSLCPRIANDTDLLFQFGYGKSFAIGRGNLSGTYKKFRIGISDEDISFFADVSSNGFSVYEFNDTGSISLGISKTIFKEKN